MVACGQGGCLCAHRPRTALSTAGVRATKMSRFVSQVLGAVAAALVLVDCTSTPPAKSLDYKSRATTRTEGGVRVSTAVLSADESAAVYGVPLATRSIQPVWIEVENREDRAYYLLSPGLDPNFFPASEASEAVASERVAGAEGGVRPALSQAGLPQPCPSWRHDFGVRADEPRRGFQARSDRPGLERAGKNFLDPLHRARLSLRLPCERSLQARYLPSRGDPELHR